MGIKTKEAYINVGKMLDEMEEKGWSTRKIETVYEKLGIFDWFKPNLTKRDLRSMQDFLKKAILLGFTGYTCFKVGAAHCANGMWAYTNESVDGYSPNDGDVLYRSFTPSYTDWSIKLDNEWSEECKTFMEIEEIIIEHKEV